MSKDLTTSPRDVAPLQSPLEMIGAAVANGMSVETVAALVELHKQMAKDEAEKAYVQAMYRLKRNIPRVIKDAVKGLGDGKAGIPYATYFAVDEAVRPLMEEERIAVSFSSDLAAPGFMQVVCTLQHFDGHKETSQALVPCKPGPGQNEAQGMAGAFTLMKRHLLCGMLNIVTVKDDGRADLVGFITDDQTYIVAGMMAQLDPESQSAFLVYMGVKTVGEILAKDFGKAKEGLNKKLRKLQKDGTA